MKRLSFIALLLLISVLVLSTGCFSNSSSYTATKAPVGTWYLDDDTGSMTLYLYENGQGHCIIKYDYGEVSAEDFELDLIGFTGYVKKIECGIIWEKIAPDTYLITVDTFDVEMHNGQSDYYNENEYSPITMGTITVYSDNVIGWDYDDSGVKYRMERI